MFAEFSNQMLQGRGQAQVLQDHGAQVMGEAPDLVHYLVQIGQNPLAFLLEALLFRGQPLGDLPWPEFQDRRGLPQFIVQFPGDPLALVLLRGH